MSELIDVYLEIGQKKVAAGVVDWPGWCRIGRSEEEALTALVYYSQRYSQVLTGSDLNFQPVTDVAQLTVVEWLEGNATTDFGAPGQIPAVDERPFQPADRERAEIVLRACWQALDETAKTAAGKTLRKGPRGGGRELEAIINHVLEGDRGYLSQLGRSFRRDKSATLPESLAQCREAILAGLDAAVRGEIAPKGPRGGSRWPAHYFVRRLAWHTLDHVWEIEDRIQ